MTTGGPSEGVRGRVRGFWRRISEGMELEELWSQFLSEARASYGFYSRDVDWESVQQAKAWKRPFHAAKALFWALLLKLSPVRRVLIVIALLFLVLSAISVGGGRPSSSSGNFGFLAAALIFLVLALELADRVTMKRDLEIAREIQHWLVPAQPPAMPGVEIAFATRPANTVAGDYYDAFLRPAQATGEAGSQLLLVVADVAGKSVPAALLMATFQASLKALAAAGSPLSAIVPGLNRYASAHSLEGRRYTTAFLAELDPATRAMTYVNAGHNAPVLRRASGAVERLDLGGLPLGISPESEYASGQVTLAAGDLLVIFTDGVVEAQNQAAEEFGEERMLAYLRTGPKDAAQATLAGLMSAVEAFVGAAPQHDDITCLVLLCK